TPIMERTINKLVKGGIPVVTFNSDVPNSNRACFVGQDLNRSGRVAAELISKYIRHDGDVLVVAGNLEFDAHMRRVNGFQSRYAELGLGSERLEVVESFNDYGITYQKVREALERKASLKAIYMANENTAACVEAIRSAATPHKVLVACNDLTDVTRRLLRKGRVDFVIKQDIYSQGYLPVMILKDILLSNKHNIEPYVFTATGIASIENMD
ncbi:MAG: substrate-binding domain-containing protein, partial [Intestinibacillus sp.]